MKYILIDGNNLAIRNSFSNKELHSSDGVSSGVHYGTMQSLIGLKRRFAGAQFLLVWDGKSKRRLAESEAAFAAGIVSETYKSGRKKTPEETPQPLKDFYEQAPFLKRAIEYTGIPQVQLSQFEADDLIASYAKTLRGENEVVCVTSDGDYFQLLDKNVKIWDGMKSQMITKNDWETENGISNFQWIDIGAMMGDTSDSICGVPCWGEKTALKEIKKYGTWQKLLAAYQEEYKGLRNVYTDLNKRAQLSDAQEIFKQLQKKKSDPEKETSRLKYPEIYFEMPYTGVLEALDKGLVKMPKTTLMALLFEARIAVAYSLKKMDDEIPDLPEIVQGKSDREKLIEYFNYYDIETLMDAIPVFE